MIMSNKVYDTLKFISQILIPAIGSFYFAIAQAWGLPYGEEVVGTLTALDACIGIFLGVGSVKYKNANKSTITDINEAEDEQ